MKSCATLFEQYKFHFILFKSSRDFSQYMKSKKTHFSPEFRKQQRPKISLATYFPLQVHAMNQQFLNYSVIWKMRRISVYPPTPLAIFLCAKMLILIKIRECLWPNTQQLRYTRQLHIGLKYIQLGTSIYGLSFRSGVIFFCCFTQWLPSVGTYVNVHSYLYLYREKGA